MSRPRIRPTMQHYRDAENFRFLAANPDRIYYLTNDKLWLVWVDEDGEFEEATDLRDAIRIARRQKEEQGDSA